MDLMLVAAIVLLASTGLWLWYLGRPQMVGLSLETWLGSTPKVEAQPRRYEKWQGWHEKWQGWYEKLQGSLLTALFVLVRVTALSAVSLIIAGLIYASVRVITGLLVQGEPISEHLWEIVLLVTGVLVTGTLCVLFLARLRWPRNIELYVSEEFVSDRPLRMLPVCYVGEAGLPRKVYEGDSHSISIGLKPSSRAVTTDAQPLDIQDARGDTSIWLRIHRDSRLRQFLEIELLAAGLEIDGERRLRQDLSLPSLSYHWSCYFPNSGNHTLTLILRLVRPSATIELGTIEHKVRVVKLDHLTKRQVWLLAALAGIVSGGLAVAEALSRLGVW